MTKVLFVCHGNICRSPMAEFVMQDLINKKGLADQFQIASAATSTEEIGNPVHPGTRNKLKGVGISTYGKYAVQLTKKDYAYYDYLIGMDSQNIRNIRRMTGVREKGKIYLLLDFAGEGRDIADPWYTGDFEKTYQDIKRGCEALLAYLEKAEHHKN